MRDPFQTTSRRGEILRSAAARYPEMDISAIEVHAALESTAETTAAAVFAPLEQRGISRGRFNVMMCLAMEEVLGAGGVSPSDIAHRLGVSRATITQLLDGLERSGLIERRSVGHDRRSQAIHLTEPGRRLFDELVPPIARNIARLLAPLSERERKTLRSLLAKLEEFGPERG